MVHSSKNMKKAFLKVVADATLMEAKQLTKSELFHPIVTVSDLETFSWDRLITKLKDLVPLLTTIIIASITIRRRRSTISKKINQKVISLVPLVCSLLNQIAFTRNKRCSLLPKLNSTKMWFAGGKRKVSLLNE